MQSAEVKKSDVKEKMSDVTKNVLRENSKLLISNLRGDVVIDSLYAAEIINQEERDEIGKLDSAKAVRVLIKILEPKTEEAINVLIQTIRNELSGMEYIAEALKDSFNSQGLR